MTIVNHPALDVSKDVPSEAVSEWVAVGWIAEDGISTPDEKPRPVRRPRRKK